MVPNDRNLVTGCLGEWPSEFLVEAMLGRQVSLIMKGAVYLSNALGSARSFCQDFVSGLCT